MRFLGVSLVLLWLASGPASAAPPRPQGREAPRPGEKDESSSGPRNASGSRVVVMIAARSQEIAARELHRAVGAQLSDAPVSLALHWVESLGKDLRSELLQARRLARGKGVAVVFWCDLQGSDDVYLYLSEPGGGRLLVRAVPQGKPSARAESLAIIVGASVRAFLQAGSAKGPGVGSGPAAPPARPPSGKGYGPSGPARAQLGARESRPSSDGATAGSREGPEPTAAGPFLVRPGPRRPPRLSLEFGYALGTYNRDNAPLHGARLALTWHLGSKLSLFVSYRVSQSILGRAGSTEVELQRNPIALGGILRFGRGRFTLGGTAALVADYVATSARATLGSGAVLEGTRAQGDWQLLALAGLVGGVEVVDRVWVELSLGAEFAIYSREYYVRVPGVAGYREEAVLGPWLVQPFGLLSLRLEIL